MNRATTYLLNARLATATVPTRFLLSVERKTRSNLTGCARRIGVRVGKFEVTISHSYEGCLDVSSLPNGNSVSLSYASTGDEPALTASGRSTCKKCRTCSRCESKWTAFENVGVPGILDGRLLDDDGRSAGRTNSPDFFRSIGGLLSLDRSDSSSSVIVSSSEAVVGVSDCFCRKSMKTDSVFDLLCPTRRSVSTVGVSTSAVIVRSLSTGMTRVNAWFVLAASPAPRFGELSLLCSIILIAACNSARFSSSRPLCALVSSSSLEFCAESGGEITACAGILEESFELGGGDCRILVDDANVR